ncbi:MAG: pyridoxal phosphate-dependent aminotransferase [Deltaproteobacteria bacterium]|jgi:cystathionine beta-lyase|nr:pyridoxal phosphate-dependent aminotransferase [Deltaproteobacteria bacterium]
MTTYDFDEIVPRKNTNCIKYDFARERCMPEGLLPLWVADMDFRTPDGVVERLVEVARHGIFGYSESKDDYYRAVADWFSTRFGYAPERAWIKKTPGVVYALAAAVRALTEPGDSVVIQTPVYYPFAGVVRQNRRNLVDNTLVYRDGRYLMDFDDLEKKIVDHKAKLMLLCSPHNPVGRVWTREELARLGEICLKHRCLIVSDEIHCDFALGGRTHHVLPTVDPALNEIAVILTAPSKTFNLAGLQASNAFIANPELRKLIRDEIDATGYSQLNTMGLAACQAAYERGGEWLAQLLAYLEGNAEFSRRFFRERLPRVRLVEPEGTYLLWLDFADYRLPQEELNRRVVSEAGLWLDEGVMFGAAGAGFQRVNMACPRSVLAEAWERLAGAFG